MEKTDRAAIVPCDIGWSDVGAWSALWEIREQDEQSNVLLGDVIAHDSTGSYVHSDGRLIALVGVRDLVVIATDDAVLVADKSRAQDVKAIVDRLKRDNRSEHDDHKRVYRPWGTYETVDLGRAIQVKHIMVKPGGATVAADASQPRRALGRRRRHRAGDGAATKVSTLTRTSPPISRSARSIASRTPATMPLHLDRGAVRRAISARTTSCASRTSMAGACRSRQPAA